MMALPLVVATACGVHSQPLTRASAKQPQPVVTAPPFNPDTLLPIAAPQLTTAVGLTVRFAATYTTIRYDEPPQTYLARLRPITEPSLATALAHATATPGLLQQHNRTRAITTGHATADQIRLLTPDTVTVVVSVHEDTTTNSGTTENAEQLAVTTAWNNTEETWLVHDVEPANTGDQGGPTDAGP